MNHLYQKKFSEMYDGLIFAKNIRLPTNDLTGSEYEEIELNLVMGHGFLFKPLKEWIAPTIKWANGNYELGSNLI